MTNLEAISLVQHRRPEELSPEQVRALREHLQQHPALCGALGGQDAVAHYLAEAEEALVQAAAVVVADPLPAESSEMDALHPDTAHRRRIPLRLLAVGLAVLVCAGIGFLTMRTRPRQDVANPIPQSSTAATPSKQRPPATGTAAASVNDDTDLAEAQTPPENVWQGWTVSSAKGALWKQQLHWNLSDPARPLPETILITGGGDPNSAITLVAERPIDDATNWLRMRVKGPQGGNRPSRVEIRADQRIVASFELSPSFVETIYLVPLGPARGSRVKLAVDYYPGAAEESLEWHELSRIAPAEAATTRGVDVRLLACLFEDELESNSAQRTLTSVRKGALVERHRFEGTPDDDFRRPTAVKGAVAYSSSDRPPGMSGQALDLTGQTGFVEATAAPGLTGLTWSIALWYKHVAEAGHVLFQSGDQADFNPTSFVRLSTAPGGAVLDITGRHAGAQPHPASSPQQWHHLVLTHRDGGTGDIYLDGVDVGEMRYHNFGAGVPLDLGKHATRFGFERFKGLLDDVQIYDQVLSPADVTYLFEHPGAIRGDGEPPGMAPGESTVTLAKNKFRHQYWDSNGTTAGTGNTGGNWTDPHWFLEPAPNTHPDGTSAPGAYQPSWDGGQAFINFSAGTNGAGPFTVSDTVAGRTLNGIVVEEGNVTLTGPSITVNFFGAESDFGWGALGAGSRLTIRRPINLNGVGLHVTGAGETIVDGALSGSGDVVRETGTGTLTINGTQIYSGLTTAKSGILLINGDLSGARGAVTVQSTATLGGSGTVGGATTVASGSKLAPGIKIGTLTIDNNLDISGALGGPTGSMLFELAAPGSSDKVVLTGTHALTIGTGLLNFNDFVFSGSPSGGTYTLFHSGVPIRGTLGGRLRGTVAGRSATLAFANGGQDIVLTLAAVGPVAATPVQMRRVATAPYAGTHALELATAGRTGSLVCGPLAIRARPSPLRAEFRFLRFAVRKQGAGPCQVELVGTVPSQVPRRYYLGPAEQAPAGAVRVWDGPLPDGAWVVVTRDLAEDFGEFDLAELQLSFDEGTALGLDHVYLARRVEDFEQTGVSRLANPEEAKRRALEAVGGAKKQAEGRAP